MPPRKADSGLRISCKTTYEVLIMKRIVVYKADAITDRLPEVEDCVIEISEKLPEFTALTLAEIQNRYANEAMLIADALFDHLPQGIFEPLLVEMMRRRISIYRGVSNK